MVEWEDLIVASRVLVDGRILHMVHGMGGVMSSSRGRGLMGGLIRGLAHFGGVVSMAAVIVAADHVILVHTIFVASLVFFVNYHARACALVSLQANNELGRAVRIADAVAVIAELGW